jgi:phosphoesterase family protein
VKTLTRPLHRAIAAAATLTGRRFGMLVASSLIATSAIVASALTNPNDDGPLAALLGRSLAESAGHTTTAAAPPATESGAESSPAQAAGGARGARSPASTSSSAPEGGSPEGADSPTPSGSNPSPTPSSKAGRIKHVFVISLASPGYEAAFGAATQMPYLAKTLRPEGELLSDYSLLESAGLPNDIAVISGQPPNSSTRANCSTYIEFPHNIRPDKQGVIPGSGCVYPVETLTIADQLSSGGFQWNAYMDGMLGATGKPENCVHPESEAIDHPALGGYATRQNPFAYFNSLLQLGACASSDLPLSELPTALAKVSTTPNYSFIAPDPCDAGVIGQCPAGTPNGAVSADAFLEQCVPKILASPAYKQDGLLILTFDETTSPLEAESATSPKVGTLLLSNFLNHDSTDSTPYNPYSLLRSTEDLFGLTHLAAAGKPNINSFGPALRGETGEA